MHEHTFDNRSVYFVKGGKLELAPADAFKPSKIITFVDGYGYMPSTKHNVKNIGSTEVIIIENEIK